MSTFNPLYYLLARRMAGAHVPDARKNRAALLGTISGDPVASVIAARSARAEFERDVLAGEETLTRKQFESAPDSIQKAVSDRERLTLAVHALRDAAQGQKNAKRDELVSIAKEIVPERRAGEKLVVEYLGPRAEGDAVQLLEELLAAVKGRE